MIKNTTIDDIYRTIDTSLRSPGTCVEFTLYEGDQLRTTYTWHTMDPAEDAVEDLADLLATCEDIDAVDVYYEIVGPWMV